jgi:hypothetical protein
VCAKKVIQNAAVFGSLLGNGSTYGEDESVLPGAALLHCKMASLRAFRTSPPSFLAASSLTCKAAKSPDAIPSAQGVTLKSTDSENGNIMSAPPADGSNTLEGSLLPYSARKARNPGFRNVSK